MVSRRDFLHSLAMLSGALCLPAMAVTNPYQRQHRLLSSVTDAQGKDWWVVSDLHGKPLNRHPLPGRGHGCAIHPGGQQAVLVGRRPSRHLSVLQLQANGSTRFRDLTCGEDRHLYGHAVYSADGRWLYTTENDIAQERGLVVVRDVDHDYRVVAEYLSGGIGPHELKLLPDRQMMVVANGGILTRPDIPREKLNIPTMRPNLSYLDLRSGQLLVQHELSDHQLSIRHLDVAPDGRVWFGCQYEGESLDPQPLVFHHQFGESDLSTALAELDVWRSLRHYTGSVVCINEGRQVAVTSPRGNQITLWSQQDGFLASIEMADVCGLIEVSEGRLLATSGKGELRLISAEGKTLQTAQERSLRWDNHLGVLG